MKYLIIYRNEYEAFYTNWYDHENNYVPGMIVIDLHNHKITYNGQTWQEIKEDHL